MDNEFLIIGLTGSLGSGCSTIANFLSNNLNSFGLSNKSKLQKTESLIGEYYEYLKNMQDQNINEKAEFNNKKEDIFIKPQELDSLIDNHFKNIQNNDESKKIINRNLRKLLHTRDILNIFCNTQWENFTLISMSTMLIKLMIEKIYDKNNIKNVEFDKFFDEKLIDNKIKKEIINIADKYNETIKEYNNLIDNKNYSNLNQIECDKIDKMFEIINELKETLKKSNYEFLLQDIGDNLRANGSPFKSSESYDKNKKFEYLDILSIDANRYIKYMRHRENKKSDFFVIDSFRNPMEIFYFRKRFGSFYLCSVYANLSIRRERLKDISKIFSKERDERDQGKNNATEELYKQNVSSCALMADYAINNENDYDSFYQKIVRFLCLINKPGCTQPTAEETFMNMAYALSLRTTCISRNVGAIITNEDGYIIGAGWNDVGSGQLGCSTRCIKDYNSFATDNSLLSVWKEQYEEFYKEGLIKKYKDNDYFCFKDLKSKLIVKEKVDNLIDKFNLNSKIKDIYDRKEIDSNTINEIESIMEELKVYLGEKLSIKRLEYARALHAEENAILQVAKNGGMGIKGGTIYVTTFPCELCAKKIYQSGIKRIIYTEPYPNSISEKIILKDGIRNIEIQQFEGVKSNSYYKLFKSYFDRKEMQIIDDLY